MRNNPNLPFLLFLVLILKVNTILAQYHLNLDFEINTLTVEDPWKYGCSEGYKIYVDSIDAYCGIQSLAIENKMDISQSFGSMSNTLPMEICRGKKIKFKRMIMTAAVDVETAIYTAIFDENNKSIKYNNSVLFMKKSIKGSTDWSEIEVESEGAYVGFGVYLAGLGKVNIDCFEIYIDGQKID